MQGLWGFLAATEATDGWGAAGVLYVNERGQLWGGDSGYYWVGSIVHEGGGVRGSMDVHRYRANAGSLFLGVTNQEHYVLDLKGGFDPGRFWLTANVRGQPELTATAELRRFA